MSSHASALALHVLSTGRREDAARILIAIWLLLQHLLLRLAAACLGLVPPDSKGWDSNAGGDNANDPDTNLPLTPRPVLEVQVVGAVLVVIVVARSSAGADAPRQQRCLLLHLPQRLAQRC